MNVIVMRHAYEFMFISQYFSTSHDCSPGGTPLQPDLWFCRSLFTQTGYMFCEQVW